MATLKLTSMNMREIPIETTEQMTERKRFNRVRKYEALKAEKAAIEKQMDALRSELTEGLEAIDDHNDRYTLIWKAAVEYDSFDQKRLEKEMPEVFAAYKVRKTKPYFRAVTV